MPSDNLGRGLGSLIPAKNNRDNFAINKIDVVDAKDKILHIPLDAIKINPMQPRKKFADTSLDELADSIKEYGIVQPLIVSKVGSGYELIAGERRLRAAKKIGLEKVPAIVRDASTQEKLVVALIENIQRENLNPIDTASGYKKLMDEFSLTQEEVSKRVGKPRSTVANSLRILNLPEEIKIAIAEQKITEGHAKYLVGLDNIDKQMNLFRKIMHNELSVEETNQEAKRMGGTKAARIKINYADKDKEFALRQFFGTKVEIKKKGKGGQIIIEYYSDDELNEIMKKVRR
jgi:ParB family transcriptional regulator, chromosome partitioning protein